MSRKLKAKRKTSDKRRNKVLRSEKPDLSAVPKKIKRYKAQRCAFVYKSTERRCSNKAVGKGTLCKTHGGDPVIKENLFKDTELALVGIDTKYDPITHPTLFIDYSRSGLSEVEIAAEFNVGVGTMQSWAEKYEMFNKAYDIGKALHEAWWIQQGKSGLNNRGFNTSLFKFLTSNKLGYSDKMETKNMNMNVHGVLMIPDKQTEEEWEAEGEIIDADT